MRIRVAGMAWIRREDANPELFERFRKILTIRPRKLGDYDDDIVKEPIRCYVETAKEFGVPRSYWFQNVKQEHSYEWDLSYGSPLGVSECLLRQDGPYIEQRDVIRFFSSRFGEAETGFPTDIERGIQLGGIFQADTGFGKCLGIGTPVLMHNGEIRPVEEIKDGDLVMGQNGEPRIVIGTTRGRGRLYKIVPVKGDSWICNDVHVLTLVHTVSGKEIDIPLDEYLRCSKKFKHEHKLFQSSCIDFDESCALPIDPYFIGLWIGDGTKDLRGVRVTKEDAEIVDYLNSFADRWGCSVSKYKYHDCCATHGLITKRKEHNPLLVSMRKLFEKGLCIPKEYLTSSRADRLRLLAGLLDSDGSLATKGSTFEFVQKSNTVSNDVAFLARSLGFRVTTRDKIVNDEKYNRLLISGDTSIIPLLVKRKQAKPRRQKKNHLRTGFNVVDIGIGEYAGFSLDGDGRFLLGDFTVTHNTDTTIGIIKDLSKTSLIIVHKEFLQVQWINRLKKWLPGIKIGIVQEKKCQFKGCDVVVAMAQSLAIDAESKRYPEELYSWPALLIVDECHRISAPTWACIPPRFKSAYRLGLTATPRRKDGSDDVFWWHIGQVAYRARTEMPKPKVRLVRVAFSAPDIIKKHNTKSAIVTTLLGKIRSRNWAIAKEMVKALSTPSGRKLMVLSERLDHLRELEKAFQSAWGEAEGSGRVPPFNMPVIGFYVGEWFTGEQTKSLKKSQWSMDGSGRDEAIGIIYKSISRRNGYSGRVAILDDGSKEHIVDIKGDDMAGVFGNAAMFDDDAPYPLTLEKISNDELFEVAKWFRVQQKPSMKMVPRTDEELFAAESARVIMATYQMCSEGVDLPAVDTIFLATPVSDVEQAVGRGRRICLPSPDKCKHWCPWRAGFCRGKPETIVTDFVDAGIPLASRREGWRRDFYASLGCVISG